jgi:nickel/cobalt exporter
VFETLPTAALAGAIGLGLVHGAEPGHGWPVAATYALDRPNKWLSGLAASTVLGIGHLISSLAVVGAFFVLKSSVGFGTARWMDYLAGGLLIALGVREYYQGHSHGGHSHGNDDDGNHEHDHGQDSSAHSHDGHSHDHQHGDSGHHDNEHENAGVLARLRSALPSLGHSHDHDDLEGAADEGIWSIAVTAFVLGFAHEEEFEIIALCAGSSLCLELMLAYALAVIVGIVGLTLLLVAGYERSEDRVERLAEHFPTISAVVLIAMGAGFVAGVL